MTVTETDRITVNEFLTLSIEHQSDGYPALRLETPASCIGVRVAPEEITAMSRLLIKLMGEVVRYSLAQPAGVTVVDFPGLAPAGVMVGRISGPGPGVQIPKEPPEAVADARTIGLPWPSPDVTWPNAKRAGWNSFFAGSAYPFPIARTDLKALWDEGRDDAYREHPHWHDAEIEGRK